MTLRMSLFTGVIIVMIIMGISACSPAENTQTDENPAPIAETEDPATADATDAVDEPEGDVPVADTISEVLFDGESLPEDWPAHLPVRPDMMFTEYTNTEEGLHAFGYAELEIPRFSNWVHNMFVGENNMVEWGQDPNNETVERGDEQIFYLVQEGWALAIELIEVDDNRCTFDITMMPAE